jgi:hypothetical protein
VNDLRKKQKAFSMNIMTVFLTVASISFMDCMFTLSPISSLTNGVGMSGDFDVVITANRDRLHEIKPDLNFYVDEVDEQENFYLNDHEKVRYARRQK